MAQNKVGAKSGFFQWQKKQLNLPAYPKEYVRAFANLSDGETVDAPYLLPDVIEQNRNELFMLIFTSSTCEPCNRNKPIFAQFAQQINTETDFKILCLSVETCFYVTDTNEYPVYSYLQKKGLNVSEYPSLFVHLPGGTAYKVPFSLYADDIKKLNKVWATANKIAESFLEKEEEQEEQEEDQTQIEKVMQNINEKGKLHQLLVEMDS